MIAQVTSKILVLSQNDKSPTKTELVDVTDESTEIRNITRANYQ